MEIAKCTHCGKRIEFGDFRYPYVRVSVKSQDLDYRFEADLLCVSCFEELNAMVGRMIREVQE